VTTNPAIFSGESRICGIAGFQGLGLQAVHVYRLSVNQGLSIPLIGYQVFHPPCTENLSYLLLEYKKGFPVIKSANGAHL